MTISLLFLLKAKYTPALLNARYPHRVTLLRGNHECRQITQVYGFYGLANMHNCVDECLQIYNSAHAWKACCQVFDYLSIGALVEGRILCIHGGLSPDVSSIDQLRVIRRAQEIPPTGALSGIWCRRDCADILWSDPEDIESGLWAISPRGAGYLFGAKVTMEVPRRTRLFYSSIG